MARIRSAKPEFWTDPLMTSLSRDLRFTFKGIFEVAADDFGRFLGDARLVKSQVWPLDDDLTVKKIDGFLQKLHDLGRIHLYEVGGIRYGQVVNWSKHQRVDHPTPSRIPPENGANGSRTPREEFANGSSPRARAVDRRGKDRKGKDLKAEADLSTGESATDEPGSAAAVAALPKKDDTQLRETYRVAQLASSGSGIASLPDGEYIPLEQQHDESPAESSAPLDVVLPFAAVEFGKTFYPRGVATDQRRSDVFEQLLGVMRPDGVAFNGGIVRATPARLSAACLAVLRKHKAEPLEDPDAAIAYLLVKLSDVSENSPTERAAAEQKAEEFRDRETFAERKARADAIAAAHPEDDKRVRDAAVKIFPKKDDTQLRETYRVAQLLKLAEAGAA